jgi:uncharacterized membrane protein YeaQ/YmgE (transglycosylase-associated protein family)
MVHHICGGLGAYLGGSIFDTTGRYDQAFAAVFVASAVAVVLILMLKRPKQDWQRAG